MKRFKYLFMALLLFSFYNVNALEVNNEVSNEDNIVVNNKDNVMNLSSLDNADETMLLNNNVVYVAEVNGVLYEDIDTAILSDGELRELFEDWSTSTFSKNDTLHQQINDILENVKDMVEFRKQIMIAQAGIPDLSALAYIESKMEMLLDNETERNETETKALNDLDKYIKDLSKLNDYQLKCAEMLSPEESAEIMRKMAENNFDVAKVAEIVADKYFGSNEHADKLKELFDFKQEEIKKKDAEIAEKNKKIVDLSTGKNVLNKKK